MKRYPFFIVVDDGAFPKAGGKTSMYPIEMDTYETILKLAKEFTVRIPVCLSMKYLDTKNISGVGEPLKYADELISFLKRNSDFIEIGYHGLTHSYEGHTGEFFCLDTNTSVPGEIQRDHIQKSAEIFSCHGIKFPEIFVPPWHAWENGVTDRILSEYGVKYLISFRKLEFNHHDYLWADSKYLEFLYREELGIYSALTNLDDSFLDVVANRLIPRKILTNCRLSRTLFNPKSHSYMTHIGNFLPHNHIFWKNVFNMAKGNPRIKMMENNFKAVEFFINE